MIVLAKIYTMDSYPILRYMIALYHLYVEGLAGTFHGVLKGLIKLIIILIMRYSADRLAI